MLYYSTCPLLHSYTICCTSSRNKKCRKVRKERKRKGPKSKVKRENKFSSRLASQQPPSTTTTTFSILYYHEFCFFYGSSSYCYCYFIFLSGCVYDHGEWICTYKGRVYWGWWRNRLFFRCFFVKWVLLLAWKSSSRRRILLLWRSHLQWD